MRSIQALLDSEDDSSAGRLDPVGPGENSGGGDLPVDLPSPGPETFPASTCAGSFENEGGMDNFLGTNCEFRVSRCATGEPGHKARRSCYS